MARRSAFSVHDRAVVARALREDNFWSATRGGHKVEFLLDRNLEPQIRWRVCLDHVWHAGASATIFDGMQWIESKIRNSPIAKRMKRMAAAKEEA